MADLIALLEQYECIVKEKCKDLKILLMEKINSYQDVVSLYNYTLGALTWYYYAYSVGDVLGCLEEELSEPRKTKVENYFGSLENYAEWLKINFNL